MTWLHLAVKGNVLCNLELIIELCESNLSGFLFYFGFKI